MKNLKLCPFCGGKPIIVEHTFHILNPTYGIKCSECEAESYQFCNTENEAVEFWNKRIEVKE